MFYINELTGEICLNRGDNAIFPLCINQGSDLKPFQYQLSEKDNIYFAIEEPNQPFENAIVKKVINLQNNLLNKDGNITVEIVPDDTVLLMPGLYYYEIKAKLYKGNQFRNGYTILKLDENNYLYSIIDEKTTSCLSTGTYVETETTYIFTDENTNETFTANKLDNYILFIDGPTDISGLKFKQENDIVNTIIPQTKWIIER